MPSNLQSLPSGLVGLSSTPYKVYVHDEAIAYTPVESDQVIIMSNNENVELDPDALPDGKVLFIKNMSGAAIDIFSPDFSFIDTSETFTLNNTEAIVIVLTKPEAGNLFFILAHYIP